MKSSFGEDGLSVNSPERQEGSDRVRSGLGGHANDIRTIVELKDDATELCGRAVLDILGSDIELGSEVVST